MSGQDPRTGREVQVFQPLGGDDPTTIAGYRLAARLGAGGMGKVYLSYTPGGRPVAIKVIRPEFGEDPEFRRRFAQEVRSAQRVQGLFTAPVIDADTDGPHPWLATAYVPGPSLADAVVAHGALPVEAVLLLIAGMAEALHVIHGAGIVHRDLKPSNVLLAADGPRVIDFGIAHAADATSLTGSGVAIGTPSFMAPEQAAGGKVTPATDIFALGQVAAYAATGTPAFGEGTSHGVLYRIVHQEPDLGAVPAPLIELVTRCLSKDPAARPTVTEVIALCQSANPETVLRRSEDWLPSPVSADITARTAAPAPPRTPPPPTSAPVGAHPPTAPAGPPASPAGFPPAQQATPPPGYGPAPAYRPAPQYLPPPGHAYPGPQGRGEPRPAPGGGRRAVLLALAAVVVFALAGGGTAYALLADRDRETTAGDGPDPSGAAAGAGGSAPSGSAKAPAPKASAKPDPTPVDHKNVNLVSGYNLTLGDEQMRPQEGSDNGTDLSYRMGGTLYAEGEGGKLVLLDPGQEGSLAACRQETRFADSVYLIPLSKGRQICAFGGSGDIGLLTIRGFSGTDSPSRYVTLDLTVWRGAAAPHAGG
ncbi:serine/threonine-protein kinase [Streptomyces sp. NPDC001553]|uniref:serine/threonine-protein kinase n=1 Tax=Streptomyces sp. NPDC001553 TaxID=3154385 RepID=UPI003332C9CB